MNNLKPFFAALEKIAIGSIEIELPNGEIKRFSSAVLKPCAHIKIKNIKMIDECLIGGDVAFGESYINDEWESNNLADLLLFLTLNSDALEHFFHAHKLKMFFLYLQAIFRKNTHSGSKKNIEYHYDLGNDFYQLWLDKSMTYSSALFNTQNCDLENAQRNKYQKILSKLNDKKNILEIGCGWGGFAYEASLKGYKVTGLTLSKTLSEYFFMSKHLVTLPPIKISNRYVQKTLPDLGGELNRKISFMVYFINHENVRFSMKTNRHYFS